MPRPNTFVNRFRYTILAVLTIATIGYGWYLYRLYFQPPAPAAEQAPSVAVSVLADGSVVIDGVTYSTPETLRPKLVQIEQAHPGTGYSINAPHGQDFSGIAKAVVLLQKSGAKTVWVINEQKKP
jgi:biopolymer transport protein ExbD